MRKHIQKQRNRLREPGSTARRRSAARRLGRGGLFVLALGVALGSGVTSVNGQEAPATPTGSVIVSTKPLAPFVFVDDTDPSGSGLSGYSIDVWNEIASRLDLATEWVVRDSVGEILADVERRDVDVAIAGISMTADREGVIDFSHPYFDSGLQVVTAGGGSAGLFSTLFGVATSRPVVVAGLGLMGLIVAVAHLVWLGERRHNPEFPSSYRAGIGEALWWSSVSLVTGGEAVKDIRRFASRILALGWMVIGLFLIAFVTAQAASSLTVRQLESSISGLDDLPGKRVATVAGTVAAEFLDARRFDVDEVGTIDDALEALERGTYDAVVFDAPVLAYRVVTEYSNRLELVGAVFAPDPYGIALTEGSELREPVNWALLEMSRDGTLDDIHRVWFGQTR